MRLAPQAPPADSVRAVFNEVFGDSKYDWELAESPLQFLWDLLSQLMFWFATLESEHPVAYWVVLALLGVMLIAILTHFGYLVWRALRYRAAPQTAEAVRPARRRDAAWYMAEAKRLAAEGRRAESLGHRFRALLLELERHKALAFHPSKTPAEYAREAQLDGEARASFAGLVQELYAHLFGGAPVSEADLDAFDHRADALIRGHAAH